MNSFFFLTGVNVIGEAEVDDVHNEGIALKNLEASVLVMFLNSE